MTSPMQPLIVDSHGTVRFQRNKIVEYLLDNGGIDLNQIARLPFTQEDREQFAQLIGYSLKGFHELSYVSDKTALAASAVAISLGLPDSGCRSTGCEIHCGVSRED